MSAVFNFSISIGTTTMGTGSTTQQTSPVSAGNISDNSLDFMFILLIVLVIVAVLLLIGIATFVTYILWRKYNETKTVISDFTSPCPESPSDVLSSLGSSAADLDTTTEVKKDIVSV